MQSTATAAVPKAPPGPYRFTIDDYLKMAETGVIPPDVRTELVDGQVIVMSPKNAPHIYVKSTIHELVQEALGRPQRWSVMDQDNIRIPDRNMPEPDIAIVPRLRPDHLPLASEAILVVEVSDTTLADDLERKRLLYAGATVPNYWVADVNAAVVHRFAEPRDGDYAIHEVLDRSAHLSVPGAVGRKAVVQVSAFFPG